MKFETEGREFPKTVKCQNNFWLQNAFLTCSWRFLRNNKLEQLEFKLEKLLGFRNMQEKLEKVNFSHQVSQTHPFYYLEDQSTQQQSKLFW